MANLIIIIVSILSFKKCRTTVALTNKSLVIMISIGDLLVGSYLLAVSLYDEVVHDEEYCKDQTTRLTSSECSILGVTSTIGSNLSLLAMTVLSLMRVHGIWNSMTIPGGVSIKYSVKVVAVNLIILVLSATVASIPIDGMVSDMFSHDTPAEDFTQTQTKVGFYGNDGVCLYGTLYGCQIHSRIVRMEYSYT